MPLAASFRTMNAVSGASEARRAVAGESDALSLDFTDNRFAASGFYGSAYVLDSGTPANYYDSTPDGLLTYTNAHEKFVMGPSGTLRYAPHNLMGYSEAFNNWTKLDATDTVTADVIANPINGTVNADSFIPSTSIGNKIIRRSWTAIVGKQYYCSIYAKPIGSYTTFMLSNNSPADRVSFTLTGSGSTNIDGGSPTNISITALDDGWYKCSFVTSPTSTAPQLQLGFYSSAFYSGFEGDGTSGGYLWGAQVTTYPCDTQYVSTGTGTTPAYGLPYEWYTSGSQRGLLIEPQATNLVTYSQNFDDTATLFAWTNTNTATLSGDAVGPDGVTNSAQTLVDSGATGTGTVRANFSATVATTTQYCFSVYAAADQLGWLGLGALNFTTPANSLAYFNLSTGAAGTEDAGLDDSGFEYVGTFDSKDWYRCWIVFTTDAADTAGECRIYVCDGDVDTTVDLDGTSSILIYGAQLETGSVPTSLIRNYGVTETRDKDDVKVDASAVPTDLNNMAMYAEVIPLNDESTHYININDGGTSDRFVLFSVSTDLNQYLESGGVSQTNQNAGTIGLNRVNRIASTYQLNSVLSAVDGTLATEDTSASVPVSAYQDIEIGQSSSGSFTAHAIFRRVIILPRYVSSTDLDSWTTTGDLP